jgi:hypothetical protein
MSITRKYLHELYDKEKQKLSYTIREQILSVKSQVLRENAAGRKKYSFPIPRIHGYSPSDVSHHETEFLRMLPEYFIDCKVSSKYQQVEINKSELYATIDWS